MSARLVQTEVARAAFFAYGSVPSRLVGVLLRLAGQDPAGVVHASHDELVAQVGSYRETVSTTLHRFQEQGLVEVGRRSIRLRDVTSLQRLFGH